MSQFNSFENAIDFSFWREICEEYGTRRSYCRGDYFTHTGTMLQEVGWIVSGGFKHSLIDNAGNIKAVGFVFDDSVLGNYQSVMLGRPMQTDIIALEDSEVLVIPAEIIRKRLAYDPTLNICFAQALFDQAYNHILNDYRFTPTERYRQLIGRFPRITQLVPLAEIASYLNISYRQLHRIRKAILKEQQHN